MAALAKRQPSEVDFDVTAAEASLIRKIAKRARELHLRYDVRRDLLDIQMDITATHRNGNPLRLQDLLDADDFDFLHDVGGIWRYLDRESGRLMNCFSPRFSVRE